MTSISSTLCSGLLVCSLVLPKIAVGAILLTTTTMTPVMAKPKQCVIYTDINYVGSVTTIKAGTGVEFVGEDVNDKASSLTVPQGYKLTVYSDRNHEGNSKTFDRDQANLGDWNDKGNGGISSASCFKAK